MGFRNTSNENTTYFSIRKSTDEKGRPRAVFATKVPKGTPNAKQAFKSDGSPSMDKDDNEVWNLEFTEIDGFIKKLENKTVEIKKQDRFFLQIHIDDGTVKCQISLEVGDRYWASFANRLLNVDIEKPVVLIPYAIPDQQNAGRITQTLVIRQGGQKVEGVWSASNQYTDAALGKVPDMRKVVVNNKEVPDFTERNNFLQAKVLDVVALHIEALYQNGGPQPSITEVPPDHVANNTEYRYAVPEQQEFPPGVPEMPAAVDEDDLPF